MLKLKNAVAQLVPVDDANDSGPGAFHAIISSPKRDRDGDQLWADEWERPLPDHIVINGDHDNNHIMSIVGSGTPTLESDNKIHVRGTWAETEYAQNTRKMVNGKHLRTLSCAYREKRGQKGVTRELVNASFVVVPSNTDCVVLDSKSAKITPNDMPGAEHKPINAAVALIMKDFQTMTPEDRVQAIHDMAWSLGSDCVNDDGSDNADDDYDEKTVDPTLVRLKELGLEIVVDEKVKTITVKHDGNELGTHKFSPAPAAPSDDADSTADVDKEKAMAKAKAMQMTMQTRHLMDMEV